MRADEAGGARNAFESGMAGTPSRSRVEERIDRLREIGGVFVEAVQATRMPMAVTDPSLAGNPIVFANDALLALSGYSMAEVLGQQPYFMNGANTDPADAATFRAALAQDRDEVIETVQYRRDGSPFIASVFLSAFKDAGGRTLYQFLSYLDVTSRVVAEQQLATSRKVEALLRESQDGLRTLAEASSQVFYRMSPDWAEMHTLHGGGFLADTADPSRGWLASYIPADQQASVTRQIARAIETRSKFELEHQVYRQDGARGWAQSWAVPILGPDGAILEWFGAAIDITERRHAEAALRKSEHLYRSILDSVRDYAIFTTDLEGRIQEWPIGAETVFGWTAAEAIGQNVAMTFMPEDRNSDLPAKERAEARENDLAPSDRWHVRKDGRRVFIEGSTRILGDRGSEPLGYLTVGQDVTGRRHWEERQKVLVAELQHRTRNLIGVVRSMFDTTRRGAVGLDDMAVTFNHRLGALARVQGLLSRLNENDRITFGELIRTELSAMGAVDADGCGARVVLDGPEGVRLRSSTVQTFALALHELATNAIKYGALAQPDGQLTVRWTLRRSDEGLRLRVDWVESGVVMPEADDAAQGSGYGRELIERALPYQLRAKTRYAFAADGVRCSIEVPVSDHSEEARSS